MGLFLLQRLFQTLYCHTPLDGDDNVQLEQRPFVNDFSDFPDYFLKKVC